MPKTLHFLIQFIYYI